MEDLLLDSFLDYDIYPFKTDDINLRGQGAKEVAIVLYKTDDNDETQELLEKIMGAVKLNLLQDTIICTLDKGEELTLQQLRQQGNMKQLLLFGVDAGVMGIRFQVADYQPLSWNNLVFLKCDSLSKIANNKKLKGALWQALQKIF